MFTIAITAPFDWSKLGAIAGAVSAFVLLVAVGIATWQVIEARRLREAQTRPFVVLAFDVFEHQGDIMLHVSNYGRTVAREVRFTFEPPLATTFDDLGYPIGGLGAFTRGLPSLAPGETLPFLFDSQLERFAHKEKHALADAYSVTVTYEGPTGRTYTDKQRLDLTIYERMLTTTRHTIHDVANRLEAIERETRKWTEGIRGLLIKTPTDVKREHEAMMKEHKRLTAAALAKRKNAQKAAKKAPRPKPKA